MKQPNHDYLDAEVLLKASELYDILPRDPELDWHTEECVITAMQMRGYGPLEILKKKSRHSAGLRIARVLKRVID